MENVFIFGLDDFNRYELDTLRDAENVAFHGLLSYDDVVEPAPGGYQFDRLLERAKEQLGSFPEPVSAIVSFFDFPSSALSGLLCEERGLISASTQSIARCEHKYWSRLEQRKVAPDVVPPFVAIDPRHDDAVDQVTIDYPCWIKPVQAHSSQLGFALRNKDDLHRYLPYIRKHIDRLGRPFDAYLKHVTLPEEVRPVGGHWCIVEGIISHGAQCTIEGYAYKGEVVCYGVIDSIRSGAQRSSFSRYQYPSRLPESATARMKDVTTRVIGQFGYDNGPFNIEFFWDEDHDELWVLEVNARISKSHCPLFRMVDGVSHQQIMVDLALGRKPQFPKGEGSFRTAAKFMVREAEDGIVQRVPTDHEIEEFRSVFPEARIKASVKPGDRLSDRRFEDSYSYSLADVFLGAQGETDLLRKYNACTKMLPFDVQPLEEQPPSQ